MLRGAVKYTGVPAKKPEAVPGYMARQCCSSAATTSTPHLGHRTTLKQCQNDLIQKSAGCVCHQSSHRTDTPRAPVELVLFVCRAKSPFFAAAQIQLSRSVQNTRRNNRLNSGESEVSSSQS